MMRIFLPTILLVIFFIVGCNKPKENIHYNSINDYEKAELWADTIIYDVLIINPDSTDEWQSRKLENLNHSKLVDDLFNSIYSGQKTAYNYYTNAEYSIDEIKDFENSYPRKDIGKLQFSEAWRYDKQTGTYLKQVYSILIAYTLYDSSNNIRGYKAGFYIKNN